MGLGPAVTIEGEGSEEGAGVGWVRRVLQPGSASGHPALQRGWVFTGGFWGVLAGRLGYPKLSPSRVKYKSSTCPDSGRFLSQDLGQVLPCSESVSSSLKWN